MAGSQGALFIYTRISHDPQGLRAGVTRQLRDCREVAKRRAWDAREECLYEDNDVSAYKARPRPAFNRLLDDLGQAYALVAYDLDRLLRQPRDLERLLDRAHEVGLQRVATAQGDLDLASHDGQLHARILAAVAKKESDDKARRVRREARDRAERGVWSGARAPLGYTPVVGGGLVKDEDTAPLVLAAAEGILQGDTLVHHAARLGMTRAGLRRLLLSPTVTGRTSAGVRGWDPILPDELAADLRALLTARGRDRPVQYHWLSGVLTCPADTTCQTAGWVFGGGHGSGSYRCPVCGSAIQKAGTEAVVEGMLFRAARLVPRSRPAPRAPTQAWGVDSSTESRLAELAATYARGELTRAEWLAARTATLPDRPQRTVALPAPPAVPSGLGAVWSGLGPARRQQIAHQLLERVEVSAARYRGRFDPSRLHPVWRV